MSKIPPPPAPKKEVIIPFSEPVGGTLLDDPLIVDRNYGEARLWLVARDPRCLFAYWEFHPEEHPDAFGDDGRAQFFLRIFCEAGEAMCSSEIEPHPGNAFIPGQSPATSYFAELGFYAGQVWCFIARSGLTHTPPEMPPGDELVIFATIPAKVSLTGLRQVLSASALPGESLAMTAARIQNDARNHGEWTNEHERLLAEIFGVGSGVPVESAASSFALTVRRKVAATAKAAAPGIPIPYSQSGNAPASPIASWSSPRMILETL